MNFKILLVVPSLARGGAERVAVNLAQELGKRHDIILCLYRNQVEYEVPKNVRLVVFDTYNKSAFDKIKNTWKRVDYLKLLISKYKPDFFLSFMGNLQPILTGRKVLVSVRNNPLRFPFHVKLQLYSLYRFPNVKKIVCVSRRISEILKNNFFLKKVTTIYNPVNFSEIDNLSNDEYIKYFYDFRYILSVGRLHPQKNFPLLIKAYAQSSLRKKYKLVILGEGSEREKLENLVEALNLKDQVLLPGKVSNPYPYMKHAKFFVLASDYEGFPNVLIESLACGTPVIATNCDTGPDEIVEHRKNGLLVPVGNEKALIEAMEELDENVELYNACKSYARESVKKFDIKLIAREWEKLFQEVLDETKA